VDGTIGELNYTGNSALAAGDLSWGAELEQQEYQSAFTEQDLDSLGLFTEWRANLAQKLYYSFGYRRDQLETDDHNSWRISAAYPQWLSGNQQIKYRASYSTGFRAPSPFEIALNISESAAAVGPETSRGYELGFEYQWAELLQLELVVFEQEIQDAIVYDYALGTSGFGAYGQDDGESQSNGLELSLAGQLSEAARWYANGTWLDTEDTQGEQRLQIAQQVYNLGLSYTLLGEKLNLSGNWQRVADRLSPDPVFFGSSVRLPDYNKLDINAVYNLSQSVRLTLRGENILDEDYREVAGFNTAGAAIYAGIQFTL
jgi:vitamin B12 transporter